MNGHDDEFHLKPKKLLQNHREIKKIFIANLAQTPNDWAKRTRWTISDDTRK
jgi:hypothetical protein